MLELSGGGHMNGGVLIRALFCTGCLALASCGTPGVDEPLRTQSGLIRGAKGADPSVRVFKGIPYAAPPIFDLRWRVPQPPARWSGVRVADKFSPICPQQGRGWGEFYQEEFYPTPEPMSEDCLYLNLWTPVGARRLPVYVWFHGVGWAEGSGSITNGLRPI